MTPFAKQWIAALRSGKYKQMAGALNKGDKFCAFGVACQLMASQLTVVVKPDGHTLYNGRGAFPPSKVLDALGLKDCVGTITSMNDHDDLSFEEIANRLLEEPDDYFR